MDEDRAAIVLATAMRAARELGDLLPVLGDDDPDVKSAVASIIYDILENVVTPVLDGHPSLKTDKS